MIRTLSFGFQPQKVGMAPLAHERMVERLVDSGVIAREIVGDRTLTELLRDGIVDELDYVAWVVARDKIELAELDLAPSAKIMGLLPLRTILAERVVPLQQEPEGALTVAVAAPLDTRELENLELQSGLYVRQCIAPISMIDAWIDAGPKLFPLTRHDPIRMAVALADAQIDSDALVARLHDQDHTAHDPARFVTHVILADMLEHRDDVQILRFGDEAIYLVAGIDRAQSSWTLGATILERLAAMANADGTIRDGAFRVATQDGREAFFEVSFRQNAQGTYAVIRRGRP